MKKTVLLPLFMMLASITPAYARTPSLNVSTMRLYAGNRYTFTLKNSLDKVSWSIKNPRIATVNDKGMVTGVKAGTTTVVATCLGTHYSAKVTVLRSRLNRTRLYTYKGAETFLSVHKLWGTKPTWSASKKLFKLTPYKNQCHIQPLKTGSGTIKAKVKGETYTCYVTVRKPLTYDDFFVKNSSKLDGYTHYFEYTKAFGYNYYWYFNKDNTNDPEDERGIVMGSSLDALAKAYGEATYQLQYSSKEEFLQDYYAKVPSSRAYTKAVYFMRYKGRFWYKIFYFDAHDKVNGIVWTNNALSL